MKKMMIIIRYQKKMKNNKMIFRKRNRWDQRKRLSQFQITKITNKSKIKLILRRMIKMIIDIRLNCLKERNPN